MSEQNGYKISTEASISLLLRLALGMLFFFAGLNKFLGEGGAGGVAQWMIGEFEATFLPRFLLVPFAYLLPYVEVTLGLALAAGVMTRLALMFTGLLLIVLAFGQILLKNVEIVSQNLNYVLIAAVALWFASKDDRYSLGRLLRKK